MLMAVGVIAPDPQNQGITVIVGSGDVAIAGISQSLRLPDVRVDGSIETATPQHIVDSNENPSNTLHITDSSTLPIPKKAL